MPDVGTHLYNAAKAAVIMLTKSAALEMAEHNVRVNAICPGFIATPLAAGRPDADESQIEQLRAAGASSQVLGRVGEPRDIANMALFLASDDASYVNGQAIAVDGGLSSSHPVTKQEYGRTAV